MNETDGKTFLNSQLEDLGRRRVERQNQLKQIDLEIGATVDYLRETLGQPKSRSAAVVKISPSHLTDLMRDASEAGHRIDDPLNRVPFLQGDSLIETVAEGGGVERVVASFADQDVFYMVGFHPDQLRDARYGGGLRMPHMALQLLDQTWVAVDNVQVGYGGTGPGNARRELLGLNIDEDLAEGIAHTRVSDVLIDQPEAGLFSNEWPRFPLGQPRPVENFYVMELDLAPSPTGLEAMRQRLGSTERSRGKTLNGFFATEPDSSHLDRLMNWLDDPADWATGNRQARVYLDESAALSSGFNPSTLGHSDWQYHRSAYTVIIEQGPLQIWIRVPSSNDPAVKFSPETYIALEAAGFIPDALHQYDRPTGLRRWLAAAAGSGRAYPPYLDVDDIPLRHMPVAENI